MPESKRLFGLFPGRRRHESVPPARSQFMEESERQAGELKLEIEKTGLLLESFSILLPTGIEESDGYCSKSLKSKFESIGDEQHNPFLQLMGNVLSADSHGRITVSARGARGHIDHWTKINMGWTGENNVFLRIDNDTKEASVFLELEGAQLIPTPRAFEYRKSPELSRQVCANQILEVLIGDLQDNRAAWQESLQQQKASYFEDLKMARGQEAVASVKKVIVALASRTGQDEEYMVLGQEPEKSRKLKDKLPIILYTTLKLTEDLANVISGELWNRPVVYQSTSSRDSTFLSIDYYGQPIQLIQIGFGRKQDVELQLQFLNFAYGEEERSQRFTIFPEPKRNSVETRLLHINPPTVLLDAKSEEDSSE